MCICRLLSTVQYLYVFWLWWLSSIRNDLLLSICCLESLRPVCDSELSLPTDGPCVAWSYRPFDDDECRQWRRFGRVRSDQEGDSCGKRHRVSCWMGWMMYWCKINIVSIYSNRTGLKVMVVHKFFVWMKTHRRRWRAVSHLSNITIICIYPSCCVGAPLPDGEERIRLLHDYNSRFRSIFIVP